MSVLMTAFDCEAFIADAIESALAQEHPADKLEVVVVDDGSTDTTAEVAERYAATGRVRVLRRPHGGNVAAANAALPHLGGDLVALLDSDDAWPSDHIRTAADLLAARPEAGLAYGDMTVIDAAGAVLRDSWHEVIGVHDPPEGRCFGRLLASTPATSSGIVVRGSTWRAITPIPQEMPMADWYLTLRAAQLSELAFRPGPRALYRFRGTNIGLGAQGETLRRSHIRRATVQRWFLRRLRTGDATPAELAAAWEAFEHNVSEALRLGGSPFAATVAVSERDRADARRRAARARGPADFVAAAAANPWHDRARRGVPA